MPVYEPGPARALDALAESLLEHYPSGHEVTLYEASPYPIGDALIEVLPLGRLADSRPTPLATLYVPPLAKRRPDPEMLERLGLDSLRRPLA